MYLADVIDLFSRKVVGYAFSSTNDSAVTCAAFNMALVRRRCPSSLTYHSDRGSNYASKDFRSLLITNGITPSMSRKGNCYDNAVAESFFHTLKVEVVKREGVYRSRLKAIASITNWIEKFYNPVRMHSANEYYSPTEYEERFDNGLLRDEFPTPITNSPLPKGSELLTGIENSLDKGFTQFW